MPFDDEKEGGGGVRRTDPHTSHDAADKVKVGKIMYAILVYLSNLHEPRNGHETANALGMSHTRDTVVPRFAPLYRWGLIERQGYRPGPTGRQQHAYVITIKGRDELAACRAYLSLKKGGPTS